MSRRFYAGLGLGLALVLVIVGLGTFATNQPLSASGRHGWFNGLLMMFFAERGARIASSTVAFASAYLVWHFSWRQWKHAGKKSNDSSKTSASEIA
jgi:hypothetical protein